jgi:hypothetical protein
MMMYVYGMMTGRRRLKFSKKNLPQCNFQPQTLHGPPSDVTQASDKKQVSDHRSYGMFSLQEVKFHIQVANPTFLFEMSVGL